MRDPRIEKLADVLVNYSVAIQPGDKVLIQGSVLGEPLLKAVYVQVVVPDSELQQLYSLYTSFSGFRLPKV